MTQSTSPGTGVAPAVTAPGTGVAPAVIAATTVVIGVGNPYRRDDGVGPAVLELLRHHLSQPPLPQPPVRLVECDGEPSALLEAWSGTALAVVIDAVRTTGARPGRVHLRSLREHGGAAHPAASSHGAGLGEAVELARALDRLPNTLLLYGVEVADTSFGVGLSEPVAAAAAELAGRITAELGDHR